MSDADAHGAIDAVWKIESARLIAGLARIVRDVGVAEDLAADALVAALEQWPRDGIPRNPGAWLMAAAKHRAIDYVRRGSMLERKHGELGYAVEAARPDTAEELNAALDDDIGDDLLRLVFTACHPVLTTEARVALTLRLLGGLTTGEIARAFLAPEPTIAQRIVRAKKTLAREQVPYEVPRGAELAPRLSSVLEVVYLIFNEGYSATAGDDWMRPALCDEALRLGRILAELAPQEPEVHGLVALMEIQASRARARLGPAASRSCCSNRTARCGTSCSSAAASPRSIARSGSIANAGRTWCRPPSPRVMPAPVKPPTPTGRRSSRDTTSSSTSCRLPSSSSIAPSPCPWRRGRSPGWIWWTLSPRCRHSSSTTCCRACAAIC